MRVKGKWPGYWAEHGSHGQKLERAVAELARIPAEVPLKDPDRDEFLAS